MGQIRRRVPHLRAGLGASAGLLALGLLVGGVVAGGAGAAGAAAGVGLVAASYLISSLVLAWADSVNPRLVLPVGLGMYVTKFTLIGIVMAVVAASGWRGLSAMGVAIIVTVFGWTIAQSVWVWRARIPYVEIDEGHRLGGSADRS